MNRNDAGNDAPRKRPIIMDRLRHNIRNDVNINEPRPPEERVSSSRLHCITASSAGKFIYFIC